jgi:hypothetical protein
MNTQSRQSDFGIGVEANAFARNYPDHELAALADALETQLAHYDRGEEFGRAVAAELRRRHEAGVRFVVNDSEDEDDAAWTQDAGPWQAIDTAPREGRIDLWVDIFELDGELVENCWWNEGAHIPDWYRDEEDGGPELGAPIFAHAAFWKPRDAAAGPLEDGGPGLLARTNVADDSAHWPEPMRIRYEAYLAALDAGTIHASLAKRGVTEPVALPAGNPQSQFSAIR